MDDAKQNAFLVQLWDSTGLYSSFGGADHGGLAGVVATNAIAVELPCDGAGCTSKSSCNVSHGVVLEMEAGQGHALFGLDLFVVFQWSDLHLRTLQGLQVLHFTFESAASILTLFHWNVTVKIGCTSD